MAGPINDNLTSGVNQSQVRNDRAELRGDNGKGQKPAGLPIQASDDAVNVSRAAEVLNSTPGRRVEGAIQTPEQASAVAQNLKALFAETPAKALATQASDTAGLGEILRVG